MPHPFTGVVDACQQSGATWAPDNALRVLEWYDGMPEMLDAMVGMLRAQGARTAEEFPINRGAGEFAARLGDQLAKYRGVLEEARAIFHAAHAEDIDRILNPGPHSHKFDVSMNRE